MTETKLSVREQMQCFFKEGNIYEIRAIQRNNGKRQIVSGYFDNIQDFASNAEELTKDYKAVYFTLNPVLPSFATQWKMNTIHDGKNTTKDEHILRRHWLPIDLDPVRDTDTSSSNEELETAQQRGKEILAYLDTFGWSKYSYTYACSGNGIHICYPINLPNDDESKQAIANFLKGLSSIFTDEVVNIDTTVSNAARIWKVYGTQTRKGEESKERPHRYAEFSCKVNGEVLPIEAIVEATPKTILPTSVKRDTKAPQEITKLTKDEKWVVKFLDGCKSGGRNQACSKLTGYFAEREIPDDIIMKQMELWNTKNNPPLDYNELKTTVSSTIKTAKTNKLENASKPAKLIKINTDEPYYIIETNDSKKLEFQDFDALESWNTVRKVWFQRFDRFPAFIDPKLPKSQQQYKWTMLLSELGGDNIEIVEAPAESSEREHIFSLVIEDLRRKPAAKNLEDFRRGLIIKKSEFVCFYGGYMFAHINNECRIKISNSLFWANICRPCGAVPMELYIDGKKTRAWGIPEDKF